MTRSFAAERDGQAVGTSNFHVRVERGLEILLDESLECDDLCDTFMYFFFLGPGILSNNSVNMPASFSC